MGRARQEVFDAGIGIIIARHGDGLRRADATAISSGRDAAEGHAGDSAGMDSVLRLLSDVYNFYERETRTLFASRS